MVKNGSQRHVCKLVGITDEDGAELHFHHYKCVGDNKGVTSFVAPGGESPNVWAFNRDEVQYKLMPPTSKITGKREYLIFPEISNYKLLNFQ